VGDLWARQRPSERDEWQPSPAYASALGTPPAEEPIGAAPAGGFEEDELRAAAAAAAAYERHPDRASFGYRLGAICIDLGTATGAAALVVLLADAAGADSGPRLVLAVVAWVLTWLAVTAGVTELTRGASLGKLASGMRVVHAANGRPLSGAESVVRDSLLRLLYVVPFFWLVDSALASGEERRGLRDRMTGTLVRRTSRYGARIGVVSLAATIGVAGSFAAAALVVRDDLRDHDVRGPLPGYTLADRNAFMFDCAGQLGPDRCTCIFDHISRTLPYARYRTGDLDRALWDAQRNC
jgi:uncharacterized RDD family membrane protein YckC